MDIELKEEIEDYISSISSSDYPDDYEIVETEEDVEDDEESMIEYINNQD